MSPSKGRTSWEPVHLTPCSRSYCSPRLSWRLREATGPSSPGSAHLHLGLPAHLPLRGLTQDLLSLSRSRVGLGIRGLRGGRKGNGIEPKGNPTP